MTTGMGSVDLAGIDGRTVHRCADCGALGQYVDGPVERIFVSPERIEAAIESLGPTGDLAEAYVKVAALAAVHVLRGGRIEYADPSTTEPKEPE